MPTYKPRKEVYRPIKGPGIGVIMLSNSNPTNIVFEPSLDDLFAGRYNKKSE
jgi:hypothetical protein